MRYVCCLLVLLYLTGAATAVHAAPRAEDGLLDLRSTSLESSGPVRLDGDWHFYWGAFYEPGTFPSAVVPMSLPTPSAWGHASPDIADHGYGTYRLRILLSARDAGRPLGLRIPGIASAYRLYVNGELAASVGKTGTSSAGMKPGALPQTLYLTTDRQELELVVQVSNYSQRKGGIWDGLRLGASGQIASEREQRTLFQTFIGASLLVIGTYHIGFYFIRRERSALYFGLASLALFLRTAFTGEMLAYRLLPAFPWEIGVKLEYLSVFCGVSFLVLYIDALYEGNLRRPVSHGISLAMIGMSLPILVLPARIYTEWMNVYISALLLLVLYIVYGLARAVQRRYTGARMNLVAGLVFLAAVLNDTLYYNFLLETIDLVALGLFVFLFTQMFMLANKFAASYREAERLSVELAAVNRNLEAAVEERTAALRKSHDRLARAEQARKDLYSNIMHELGNPLTTILGYLQRLRDGASREQAARHIEIAYRKARKLERLTRDLRQLVKLEHNQLSYRMRPCTVRELFRELDSAYDWSLLDRRVTVRWADAGADERIVLADLGRIEQVFANLVNNALTHTKAGDRIDIVGRLFPYAHACAVSVQDAGCGIPREHQAHLFERFYRVQDAADPDSDQTEGTGLGLAIAKAIVEAHRGRIGLRSEYGAGSTFYFVIPFDKAGTA
jgi:signal transduction histidine kinase